MTTKHNVFWIRYWNRKTTIKKKKKKDISGKTVIKLAVNSIVPIY